MSSKVFVLALDGATFDLIRPWAAAGKLPLFAQLMQESAWGEIESTTPPITPVAWLTFVTGKNPGKHGVYNFFDPVRTDYTAITPISTTTNTEMAVWDLLSQQGRHVCVLNVPMTFPPRPVNGELYAGMPMPMGDLQYSYPPDLHDELLAHGWDLRKNAGFSQGTYEEFLQYLQDLVTTRTEATLHLMQTRPWDFFMVHYLETDQVAHMYWRFWENESPEHPLHDAMLTLYQHMEGQMARIQAQLPADATLVIVSDHGMGPVHCHLHLNNWLLQEGFLRWQDNFSTRLRRFTYKLGVSPTSIYRRIPESLLKRLTLGQTRAEFAQIQREVRTTAGAKSLVKHWFANLLRLPFLYLSDIDWARSQAYSGDTTQAGLIYLNVRGREPDGCVAPGEEYERLRAKIRDRLYGWVNPLTGQKMVARVCLREELYSGHQLANAPDLIVFYHETDYESRKGAIFLSTNPLEPIKNAYATHRLMGMLMVTGPAIQPRLLDEKLTLTDMAALILYLMDEAIPEELDGRFPAELLQTAHLAAHPPTLRDYPHLFPRRTDDRVVGERSGESVESIAPFGLSGLGWMLSPVHCLIHPARAGRSGSILFQAGSRRAAVEKGDGPFGPMLAAMYGRHRVSVSLRPGCWHRRVGLKRRFGRG